MLKLVFSPEDKRLLGVHQIGELASELIHIGAHVLAEGGTIDAFIGAVYNYPSLADAYKYAAYDSLGAPDRWLIDQRGITGSCRRSALYGVRRARRARSVQLS